MIRSFASLIALSFSFSGYYRFTSGKLKIAPEFCLSIIFSFCSCVLILGGIVNLLVPFSYLLFILGIVVKCMYIHTYIHSFIHSSDNRKLIKASLADIKNHLSPGVIIFSILTLFLFFRLYNCKLYDYDNFTHWATIIKQMMLESRLPNSTDTLIAFPSYPVGSSVWIWYICRFIGFNEGCEMFAQIMLILAFSCSIFAFCRKKISYIVGILSVIIFTAGNLELHNNMFSLLVDLLLTVTAFASLAIVIYYHGNTKKSALYSLPILLFLSNVKTSGALFVVAILIYALTETKSFKDKSFVFSVLFGPWILMMVLWKIHTKMAFHDVTSSNHSVSLSRYIDIWNSRTSAQNAKIIKLFISSFFTYKNTILILMTILSIVIIIVSRQKRVFVGSKKLYLFLLSLYIVYFSGLLLMYLFSMKTSEAIILSWFERYQMTMDYLVLSVLFMQLIRINEETETKTNYSGMLAVLICLYIICLNMDSMITFATPKPKYLHELSRDEAERLHDESNLPLDVTKSYLLYYPEEEDKYIMAYRDHVMSYYFWSPKIYSFTSDSLPETNEYDYIIIYENDEIISDWIRDNNISASKIVT